MTSVSKNVYIDKLADIFNEPWTHAIEDLNGEKIARAFHEKELQKPNQKEFAIERAIKRKGNKLFCKWRGYYNSFNSWIDEKNSYIKRLIFQNDIINIYSKQNES